MATSAVAGTSHGVDPLHSGKYTIQLGPSLRETGKEESSFSSVIFNHKPSQARSHRTTTIDQTDDAKNPYTLTILDDKEDGSEPGEIIYTGRESTPTQTYILTFDADQQTMSLDEAGPSFTFNMVSAPWEHDSIKLAQKYRQIPDPDTNSPADQDSENEDVPGVIADDIPDPKNPFDYRHYLAEAPRGRSNNEINNSRPPSAAPTPLVHPQATFSSPAVRPHKAQPLRKKAPINPLRRSPAPRPVTKIRVPAKRPQDNHHITMSSADDDDDEQEDSGGLTIDMGDAPPRTKRRPAQHLTKPSGGRPISLRTAAASVSPAVFAQSQPREARNAYDEEEDDDDGADDEVNTDGDVDELNLPGPAVEGAGVEGGLLRRNSTWDADAEAELHASLAEALGAQLEEEEEEEGERIVQHTGAAKRAQESDSESEEE